MERTMYNMNQTNEISVTSLISACFKPSLYEHETESYFIVYCEVPSRAGRNE